MKNVKLILAHVLMMFVWLNISAQDAGYEWNQTFGGIDSDRGTSIRKMSNGNTVTFGSFNGTIDLDPGTGVFNVTAQGFSNSADLFIVILDSDGNFVWGGQIGGIYDDLSVTMNVDANNNIYLTALLRSVADVDPGIGISNVYTTGLDAFLIKLDAGGNFNWVNQISGTICCTIDVFSAITFDLNNNIIVGGYISGIVDVDPGAGVYNLNSVNGSSFIIAYNPSGNFLWATQFGGNVAPINSIITDANQDILIGGYFNSYGTSTDFDPGAGVYNLASNGFDEAYVLKLSSAGAFVWAKSWGGNLSDRINSVAVDNNNNLVAAGYFSNTIDMDPGVGTTNFTSFSANNPDIFIVKLDVNGNFIWANQQGGTGYDIVNEIAIDGNDNIYSIGNFKGTADMDPSTAVLNFTAVIQDVYICRFNSSGTLYWAKQFVSNGSMAGTSICISQGDVYSTGQYRLTCDFDPDPMNTENFYSNGSGDVFINKLSSCGNSWAVSEGSTSDDAGRAVAVDASGNIYTTGFYSGTVDFDKNPATTGDILISHGLNDIFIQKHDVSGNLLWVKGMGGIYDDRGITIVLDSDGELYVGGYYSDVTGTLVDFDPGIGVVNLTAKGWNDIFVLKMDANGNLVWASGMGGASDDQATSLAVDPVTEEVYVTGWFALGCDFDPGAGIIYQTAIGNRDAFVSKLSSGGGYVWAVKYGSPGHEYGQAINLTTNGKLITAGHVQRTTDMDPNPLVTNNIITTPNPSNPTGYYHDIYIQALNTSNGYADPTWNLVHIKGRNHDYARGLTSDISGNVYLTGSFTDTIYIDLNNPTVPFTAAGGHPYQDFFIQKFNNTGQMQWVKNWGGSRDDIAYTMKHVDGNLYVSGAFSSYGMDFDPNAGTSVLNPSYSDPFVMKLDDNGNFFWAKRWGGAQYDYAFGMDVTGDGIHVTGNYQGLADMDPDANLTNNFTNAGAYPTTDFFLVKIYDCSLLPLKNYQFNNSVLVAEELRDDLTIEPEVKNEIITENDDALRIYPNPAQDILTINSSKEISNALVIIQDMNGRMVMNEKISGNNVSLDVSLLQNGVYIIQLITNEKRLTERFIIAK